MKAWLLAIIKEEKGLCAMAFLIALFAIFESTVMHGLEILERYGVIESVQAAEMEEKK